MNIIPMMSLKLVREFRLGSLFTQPFKMFHIGLERQNLVIEALKSWPCRSRKEVDLLPLDFLSFLF